MLALYVCNTYIAGMKKPKPKYPRIQLDFNTDYLEQFQFMADRDHRTRKAFLELLLMKAADDYPIKWEGWKGGIEKQKPKK
jgi:hypothetical protein